MSGGAHGTQLRARSHMRTRTAELFGSDCARRCTAELVDRRAIVLVVWRAFERLRRGARQQLWSRAAIVHGQAHGRGGGAGRSGGGGGVGIGAGRGAVHRSHGAVNLQLH